MTDPQPEPAGRDFLMPLEDLARGAGEVLMKHFRQLETIEHKGDIDLVTVADREAEDYLAREILARYPDHAIMGEEHGTGGRKDADFLWVIDPLDGTTNYAHGLRLFAVSIGLLWKGNPLAAAVYAPAQEEMYLAAAGNGATRNGRKLKVSATALLRNALLVTGFPYERDSVLAHLMSMMGECLKETRGVLRLGSAALDLAAVASGEIDGFYEWGLKPWDTAAGVLLVREAGGTVSGLLQGEEFDIFKPRLLASNGVLHDRLYKILARGGADQLPR